MAHALVLGATSAIAQATARLWAARGDSLALVARDADKLAAVADDLRARGAARIVTHVADLDRIEGHAVLLDACWQALGTIDVALVAYGVLGEPDRLRDSPHALGALLQTDFVSPAALAERLVAAFERQGRGTLAVIGSVAGDRGRQSNYAYGAAKAGLATFLQGMRHRLAKSPVRVVLVKPGFVDTPMTARFAKGPLWASPERVARGIDAAIRARRPVAYVPGFWRAIMLVVRALPEWILFRTRL